MNPPKTDDRSCDSRSDAASSQGLLGALLQDLPPQGPSAAVSTDAPGERFERLRERAQAARKDLVLPAADQALAWGNWGDWSDWSNM